MGTKSEIRLSVLCLDSSKLLAEIMTPSEKLIPNLTFSKCTPLIPPVNQCQLLSIMIPDTECSLR